MFPADHKDCLDIDIKIVMCDDVTQSFDFFPVNFRIITQQLARGDLIDLLENFPYIDYPEKSISPQRTQRSQSKFI